MTKLTKKQIRAVKLFEEAQARQARGDLNGTLKIMAISQSRRVKVTGIRKPEHKPLAVEQPVPGTVKTEVPAKLTEYQEECLKEYAGNAGLEPPAKTEEEIGTKDFTLEFAYRNTVNGPEVMPPSVTVTVEPPMTEDGVKKYFEAMQRTNAGGAGFKGRIDEVRITARSPRHEPGVKLEPTRTWAIARLWKRIKNIFGRVKHA